jgi:hypothetical protein
MISLAVIKNGGSGRVEGSERCEACMRRAHCAIEQEAELGGPGSCFEWVFMVMTVQVD